MGMGATIVTYTVAPGQAEELYKRAREHVVPAARSAKGYRGFLLLDQGDGKRLALVLFDSVQEVQAAQAIIGPDGREHVHELMSSPSVGALGTTIISDGIFAAGGMRSGVLCLIGYVYAPAE